MSRHEPREKMNTRMTRLEAVAAEAGVALSKPSKNQREFGVGQFRTIRFRTEGRSTMRIESRHSGVLDASMTARDDKVAELIRAAGAVAA